MHSPSSEGDTFGLILDRDHGNKHRLFCYLEIK